MFESKEILEEFFPIGYIYKEDSVQQRFYCADDIVLDKIRNYHGYENVKWISPHHVLATHKVYHTVDAYVYMNDSWWPATMSGDHIIILTKDDVC